MIKKLFLEKQKEFIEAVNGIVGDAENEDLSGLKDILLPSDKFT